MTRSRRNALILTLAAAAILVAVVSYQVGRRQGQPAASSAPRAVAVAAAKPLYWYDPMVPNQHFDRPGKSPFMDMQLVPRMVEPGGGGGAPGVSIDARALQNLGIRTATVEEGTLDGGLTATGIVEFNGRDVAIVQPRTAGFVQRVYRWAPGDVIAAGALLADLLAPDWLGAQTEFLAVRRTGDVALIGAARQRLLLLGMSPSAVAAVERSGRPQAGVTVTSPIAGVIQKLDVRQGMSVSAGQTLAEINGLSTVWINAAVPEGQAARVRQGQPAKVSVDAYPGEAIQGRVQSILPQVAGDSRTLQVRIELPNRGGRLRPGMFAQVAFDGDARPALLLPSEALIRTGRRTLVMLAGTGGRYEPVEVRIGREGGGKTEVLAGLQAGDRVVASGQFLIDSEASLLGLNARPLSAPPTEAMQAPPTTAAMATTTGRVEAVAAGAITLSHEPVPAVGWPAMTMTFQVADPKLTRGLRPGDRVRFGFDQPSAGPTVRSIERLGAVR